jgi:RNA polymerase sigma-70 factor, ECF subfamily
MSQTVISEIETLLPILRRFARSLTRDMSQADDLVQDTVERALKRIESFQEGTNLKAWLFTIMRNRFISECRKPKPVAGSHEIDSGQYDVGIPGAQQDTVELKEFQAAFSKLSPSDQELLILAGLENIPYPEIAQMLKVAIGTVKSRVARARSRLRSLHVGHVRKSGQARRSLSLGGGPGFPSFGTATRPSLAGAV